jgi:hypothetical protein
MARLARRARLGRGRRSGIFSPEQNALVSAVRILKSPAHFHFDFVDERLAFADLRLNLPRRAQERAKFSRSPAGEGRLVLALKAMPAAARLLQTRHRRGAIRRRPRAQWRLIDQDEITPERIDSGICHTSIGYASTRHRANLRA